MTVQPARPVVLFYCQRSLGMGHLIRSMALAAGLAQAFRVVFLNGGPLPKGINMPAGVEIINLPPVGLNADNQLVSSDRRRTAERAFELRRKIILETFQSLRPQIVLIELFPFGRKKFAGELLPLLDEARGGSRPRPLIICSLRDILVGRRTDQQKHDARAVSIANQYFDAILVHSDPRFARLEESFQACSKLRPAIHYTGYVSFKRDAERDAEIIRGNRVIVSAGGGIVGRSLFQTAVEAHALLRDENVEMKIIAGPFLPEPEWQELRQIARGRKGLQLSRCIPDLCEQMRAAAASVSQCGYNTSLDILQSGVPALVVPYAEGLEDEQTRRAERLSQLGAIRVLEHRLMNPRSLADEIRSLLKFKPKRAALDLNGVANSAQTLESLLQKEQSLAASSSLAAATGAAATLAETTLAEEARL
jgi:predicted glycosyltransferase